MPAPRRRYHAWFAVTALLACGFSGTAVVALAVALAYGGWTAALAVAAAVLPLPVYAGLAIWIDRIEPEPPRLLAATFAWGASGAVLLSWGANEAASHAAVLLRWPSHHAWIAVAFAPVVEECAKAVALFALYRWCAREVDDVLDGIVYASMVGLGFGCSENVLYYGSVWAQGGEGEFAATLLARGLFSPYGHPLFTAATGIGLARALRRGKGPGPLLAGLGAAIGLHASWNLACVAGSAGAAGFAGLVYLLLWVPLFVVLLGLVAASLAREELMMRRMLAREISSLGLPSREIDALFRLRSRARLAARDLSRGWFKRLADRRRFHRAAGALAFSRLRAERGFARNPEEEEELRWEVFETARALGARWRRYRRAT
ncbi:MAG: protease PrsW [Acidobacteria bacterium]|nr:MAG: protease PrsW [Acidobacteriota bacterium]